MKLNYSNKSRRGYSGILVRLTTSKMFETPPSGVNCTYEDRTGYSKLDLATPLVVRAVLFIVVPFKVSQIIIVFYFELAVFSVPSIDGDDLGELVKGGYCCARLSIGNVAEKLFNAALVEALQHLHADVLAWVNDDDVWRVVDVKLLFEFGLLSSLGPEPSPLLALVDFDHVTDHFETIVSALCGVIQDMRQHSNRANLSIVASVFEHFF